MSLIVIESNGGGVAVSVISFVVDLPPLPVTVSLSLPASESFSPLFIVRPFNSSVTVKLSEPLHDATVCEPLHDATVCEPMTRALPDTLTTAQPNTLTSPTRTLTVGAVGVGVGAGSSPPEQDAARSIARSTAIDNIVCAVAVIMAFNAVGIVLPILFDLD